jgi:translation initiation factor IF-2
MTQRSCIRVRPKPPQRGAARAGKRAPARAPSAPGVARRQVDALKDQAGGLEGRVDQGPPLGSAAAAKAGVLKCVGWRRTDPTRRGRARACMPQLPRRSRAASQHRTPRTRPRGSGGAGGGAGLPSRRPPAARPERRPRRAPGRTAGPGGASAAGRRRPRSPPLGRPAGGACGGARRPSVPARPRAPAGAGGERPAQQCVWRRPAVGAARFLG